MWNFWVIFGFRNFVEKSSIFSDINAPTSISGECFLRVNSWDMFFNIELICTSFNLIQPIQFKWQPLYLKTTKGKWTRYDQRGSVLSVKYDNSVYISDNGIRLYKIYICILQEWENECTNSQNPASSPNGASCRSRC